MAGNLKLDSNHDIIIGRGATRVGGVEYVAQLCKCRLLTLLREWQNDPTLGLPWYEEILTKNSKVADIQVVLANVIRKTNHVRQITSLEVLADYRTRLLTVNFTAISDYGDVTELVEWRL